MSRENVTELDTTLEFTTDNPKVTKDILARAVWITLTQHLPAEFGLTDMHDDGLDETTLEITDMETLLKRIH